jgi:hypothetical protein
MFIEELKFTDAEIAERNSEIHRFIFNTPLDETDENFNAVTDWNDLMLAIRAISEKVGVYKVGVQYLPLDIPIERAFFEVSEFIRKYNKFEQSR